MDERTNLNNFSLVHLSDMRLRPKCLGRIMNWYRDRFDQSIRMDTVLGIGHIATSKKGVSSIAGYNDAGG